MNFIFANSCDKSEKVIKSTNYNQTISYFIFSFSPIKNKYEWERYKVKK